jgi:hypothetical protein
MSECSIDARIPMGYVDERERSWMGFISAILFFKILPHLMISLDPNRTVECNKKI